MLENINVCSKCRARLIEEESNKHECDLLVRISGNYLLLRNGRGLWVKYAIPETMKAKLGDIPPEIMWNETTMPPKVKQPFRTPDYETEPNIKDF